MFGLVEIIIESDSDKGFVHVPTLALGYLIELVSCEVLNRSSGFMYTPDVAIGYVITVKPVFEADFPSETDDLCSHYTFIIPRF